MNENKKIFILLFQYTTIDLFEEIDGKLQKVKFANGKDSLSNCVTFSYESEDLLFLPDGDPFAIDSNSSFSDFLNFAGYHFEPGEAVSEIVRSIIKNKLINHLGKNDEILLCWDNQYYEDDDLLPAYHIETRVDKQILGHNVFVYNFQAILELSAHSMIDLHATSFLVGTPFFSFYVSSNSKSILTQYLPTLEISGVTKINQQYPLPSTIPAKLLRNIRNRILVSKLYNLPLPENAIYQNQKIDIAHTKLAERIDNIIKENSLIITNKLDKPLEKYTLVFDFGIHPYFKKEFAQFIEKPIMIEKKYNVDFLCFILRNAVIQHKMNHDLKFKATFLSVIKRFDKEYDYKIDGDIYYFNLKTAVEPYFEAKKMKNLLKNKETEALRNIISNHLGQYFKVKK